MENKLKTIINLFQGKEIRSIWDSEEGDYYFSVVDVIKALTDSVDASDYWTTLKRRMLNDERSELPTKCRRLKMIAKDGKNRETDTLNTEGIFRLIESVPSAKAEPFKLWMAKLGRERVDEVFDPSIGIDKMIDYYLKRGYNLEWIERRIRAIINRKKLTKVWKDGGIKEEFEYGILTNEIYKEWSGMTAREYKDFKGLRKENLRDNMSDIEVALTDLGELATRIIASENKYQGFKENKKASKLGGHAAKLAKNDIEKNINKSVITSNNLLNYKYLDDNKNE